MADKQELTEKLTLENGLEITLRPASQVAIDELVEDMGGYELQSNLAALPESEIVAYFKAMSPDELKEYNAAHRRQALYCLGFGVVSDPPASDIEILRQLGKHSDIPQIRRAHWLLYVAGMTREDKSRVVGTIMALTRLYDGR